MANILGGITGFFDKYVLGFALGTFAVLDPEALAEASVAAVDAVEPILEEILSR